MRVLHVTPAFFPARRYGGPIEAVLRMCVALNAAGAEVSVATTTADGPRELDVPTEAWTSVEGVPVRYFRRALPIDYAPSLSLARFVAKEAKRYDLVHITSTFSFPSLAAGWSARRARVPYVVSPHGSLLSWSLRAKRWKKLPYWVTLERPHLRRAAGIHVTATTERDDVARVLPGAEIFVVPNGQEEIVPPVVARDPRRVVFLGRIHPKKGFDVLIPAMSRVAREMPGVELLVAGHDPGGEWDRVHKLATCLEPRPAVRYLGAIYGAEKYRLLASAAAFVLTSHSENFGMTVLEALACGTPAVVSKECPWEELELAGAGRWIDNTPDATAAALLAILRDPQGAARMGEAGRRLAASYRWEAVGTRMVAAYERILAANSM